LSIIATRKDNPCKFEGIGDSQIDNDKKTSKRNFHRKSYVNTRKNNKPRLANPKVYPHVKFSFLTWKTILLLNLKT
jgi:hypothetical protein